MAGVHSGGSADVRDNGLGRLAVERKVLPRYLMALNSSAM
jgi:hypothetical protein